MKIRQLQFAIFSIIVSAGILIYLFSKVSLREVVEAIGRIPFDWIILFVFFSFTMSVFRTWRYKLLLGASGYHPSELALFLINLVRNFFSDLLPARLGTLIYVYLVRSRLNIPLGPAISSFAYSFLFDIIGLALILLPAVVVASFGLRSAIVLVAIGLLLAGVSIAILYLLPYMCGKMAQGIHNISLVPFTIREKLNCFLTETEEHLRLSRSQGIYWKVLALSVAVRLCKYLSLYFLLVGLVIPLGYSLQDFPFVKVFPGMCGAELASSLPISGIAGFGVYEGAWACVFQLLGYPEKVAILTSLSHHLITQVYGYSLGGIALIVLLLPFFNSSAGEPMRKQLESRNFWPKFCLGFLSVIVIGILLVPEGGGNTEARTILLSTRTAKTVEQLPVKGRLLYERSEGIYLTDLATGEVTKMVTGGRYPRWSPDGKSFACIRGKYIVHITLAGNIEKVLAEVQKGKALCFSADGKAVLYTDGRKLKRVEVNSLTQSILPSGGRLMELDMSEDGKLLAATEKTIRGYKVKVYTLPDFTERNAVRGCSASLSPYGEYVTVNSNDHQKLYLYSTVTKRKLITLAASETAKFDNQFWTNHPDWLVSTAEGDLHDIWVHSVVDGAMYQLTFTGDCDRADLFITDVHN